MDFISTLLVSSIYPLYSIFLPEPFNSTLAFALPQSYPGPGAHCAINDGVAAWTASSNSRLIHLMLLT